MQRVLCHSVIIAIAQWRFHYSFQPFKTNIENTVFEIAKLQIVVLANRSVLSDKPSFWRI
jgi:hypothetical protein